MSDTRCDGFNILMWPLAATVAISCFPWYEHLMGSDIDANIERWIVQGLTIFVTVAHLHYGHGVVNAEILKKNLRDVNIFHNFRCVKCATTLKFGASK